MSGGRDSRPSLWTTGFDGVQYPGPTVSCILGAVLSLVFAVLWWSNAVSEGGTGYAAYLVGGLHAPSVRPPSPGFEKTNFQPHLIPFVPTDLEYPGT